MVLLLVILLSITYHHHHASNIYVLYHEYYLALEKQSPISAYSGTWRSVASMSLEDVLSEISLNRCWVSETHLVLAVVSVKR